jgi:hypothetical protein
MLTKIFLATSTIFLPNKALYHPHLEYTFRLLPANDDLVAANNGLV